MVDVDPSCWFCGGPAAGRHAYPVGVHRNYTQSFHALGLVAEERWERYDVRVPRCGRCRVGHVLDGLVLLGAVPTLAGGMGLLLDTALGTYSALPPGFGTAARIGVWFLPFIAWGALRHGRFGLGRWFPHNRRYVRRQPVVREMLNDGWRYGRAPMTRYDKRWFPE